MGTRGLVVGSLALAVAVGCSDDPPAQSGTTATASGGSGGTAQGGGGQGGGAGCISCDPCDVDGDGREHAGEGCAGDDCDDSHPNCWDAATQGCCSGEGLLFHSEFEGGVTIDHTPPAPASQWRLAFHGLDSATGYDWSTEFPEDGAHVTIQALVHGSSELVGDDPARITDPRGEQYGTTGFVDAEVLDHPGVDGSADNQALFFHSWRSDPAFASTNSRLQVTWYPPAPMRQQGGEIYVAHWLKLQPDLYHVHTAYTDDWHSRWRSLGEWWNGQSGCGQDDFRQQLYLETYNSDFAFWRVAGGDTWTESTADRPDLAPAVDRWFFLEIYTLRHPTAGRVWVGVDGMTLFDVQGVQTMPSADCWDDTFVYNFLKMYGDLYNYEDRIVAERPPYQFWQYYDGLRIYDRLPSGHCAIDSTCPLAADLAD
ncbi:MAG: hypothetical protein JRI23_25125 [Deltaproteobacteria bacterium]|jgi:hypothetical protein|nr:hypothetical protein [Deltaproteobacteria bacterium]MBW2535300.1 hypothetical protein [Deltaproteobacteria bacterium]